MCYDCWEQYGKPALSSEQIQRAIEQIEDVYAYSLSGGHLHIVLDDWNLGDGYLDTCEQSMNQDDGKESLWTSSEQIAAERACLATLRSLTEDERASALARYEGFVEEAC